MARNRRPADTRTAPVAGGLAEIRPDRERPQGRTLFVDGAPQSHVDLADPAYLDFSYQRRLGHVIDLVAPPGQPPRQRGTKCPCTDDDDAFRAGRIHGWPLPSISWVSGPDERGTGS